MPGYPGVLLNILFLTSYLPAAPDRGSAIRSHHFLRGLAARGHRVRLLSFVTDAEQPRLAALRGVCAEVTAVPLGDFAERRSWRDLLSPYPYQLLAFRDAAFRDALVRLQREDPPDLVQIDLLRMAPYRDAVPGRCVLDTHNVESVRARRTREATPFARRRHRWISRIEERKVARWERDLSPRFDRVITVSEGDAGALRALVPAARVTAVPMGVDLDYFRCAPDDPSGRRIVFAGSLFYGSNADAVRFFVDRVLPGVLRDVPDARFTAVGHEPPHDIAAMPARLPQVAVTGSVPDVRPYLEGAAVVVCPLRSGGGVKSKVLEGMAVGRPVVTTSVGAEGIEGARDGEHWIVRDDPDAFAREVAALLRDPARRAAIGAAARRLVEGRYGWGRSLDVLESVYRDVMAGGARR